MDFMFSWQEQYLTRSLRSLVRYCSCHSNIKSISSRNRVVSSIYMRKSFTCLCFMSHISMSTGCILQFMYTFSIEVRQPHCEYIPIVCMIYYAVFKCTKSTHCLRRFLPSGLSSSAKGIKCNEISCFLSVNNIRAISQCTSIRYFF